MDFFQARQIFAKLVLGLPQWSANRSVGPWSYPQILYQPDKNHQETKSQLIFAASILKIKVLNIDTISECVELFLPLLLQNKLEYRLVYDLHERFMLNYEVVVIKLSMNNDIVLYHKRLSVKGKESSNIDTKMQSITAGKSLVPPSWNPKLQNSGQELQGSKVKCFLEQVLPRVFTIHTS